MRKVATVQNSKSVRRVMLFERGNNVMLFEYSSPDDGPATGDYWFATLSEAEYQCEQVFGVGLADWKKIDDPQEGCQEDWIKPVRVKGRDCGQPDWGHFQEYKNGEWVDIRE